MFQHCTTVVPTAVHIHVHVLCKNGKLLSKPNAVHYYDSIIREERFISTCIVHIPVVLINVHVYLRRCCIVLHIRFLGPILLTDAFFLKFNLTDFQINHNSFSHQEF